MNVLRRPVLGYFESAHRAWAVQALHTYSNGKTTKGEWLYSGAWFDRLIEASEPNAFTANDIVAVSMLSVTVPALAAIKLLRTDDSVASSKLLRRIDAQHPIWEADQDELGPGSPADELWHLLRSLDGVGSVIAGKLIAAKRPNLIPVYDQHVQAALGPPRGQFWTAMSLAMREAHETVAAVVNEAGVDVTPLRAVDIVVWMHQHGWTWADESLEPPPRFT